MTDMGIGDPIRDDLKVKLPSARAWNTLTLPSPDTERACMHLSFFTRPQRKTTSIRPDTHPTTEHAQAKQRHPPRTTQDSGFVPVHPSLHYDLDHLIPPRHLKHKGDSGQE